MVSQTETLHIPQRVKQVRNKKMKSLLTACLLAVLLSGCGGGHSIEDPGAIDAYVGRWSHCEGGASSSLLTVWNIDRTSEEAAHLTIIAGADASSNCSGQIWKKTVLYDGQLKISGTRSWFGMTWHRIVLDSGRKELIAVVGPYLRTSMRVDGSGQSGPVDGSGYPESFGYYSIGRAPSM
jgi:hypothetical protein